MDTIDPTLGEAYRKISGADPDPEIENWEVAQYLKDHWDVPKMGQDLALRSLFRIINHIAYPNQEINIAIVGHWAEEHIGELIEVSPYIESIGEHDTHMAYIAEVERQYWERKNIILRGEMKIR